LYGTPVLSSKLTIFNPDLVSALRQPVVPAGMCAWCTATVLIVPTPKHPQLKGSAELGS